MNPTPTPSWYDVLGISRDADPDQIKAAWREATDKFEPGSGSGQFRMFNEAATVLLDPEQRRHYDATLDAEPQHAAAPAPVPGPVPTPETAASVHAEAAPPPGAPAKRSGIGRGVLATLGGLSTVTLVILAALTVAVLVATAFAGVKVQKAADVIDSRDEAPAAAERAAKAVLSYDYRTLPADRERAGGYLTDGFKKTYLKNFALLEKQKDGTPGAAVQTKTVVTSSVLGSGVMDAEDNDARVLVFVNQVSKRPGADPQIFQNRVAMKMEKVGDRWLVDNLKSY